jgi:NAD(P)-dependent dehydrogenase (short-subunit alcohol dehydrogenase family)
MSWSVGAGLAGKGVLVTGASGGIGRSVAEAFAHAGAYVMAVDLRQDAVDAVVAGLESGRHLAVGADLRDIGGHGALVARARAELGSLDVLVNVAGVMVRRTEVDEVSEDDWDRQVDVNLKASFFLCRAAAREMRDQGHGGRIVTFTSQAWWTGGFGGSVVYSASKGGVVSMTRGLARTYGPYGITVNAVAPGLVRTPMLMDGLERDTYDRLVRQIPLGRVAEPSELAGTVVFLASDHAAYISGATINVSGGFLMY